MKCILSIFSVVVMCASIGAAVLDESITKATDPNYAVIALKNLPAAEMMAEIEAVKNTWTNDTGIIVYATISALSKLKENPDMSYAEYMAIYDSIIKKEFKAPYDDNEMVWKTRVLLANTWYTGKRYEAIINGCVSDKTNIEKANKLVITGVEFAQLLGISGVSVDDPARKNLYMKNVSGKRILVMQYMYSNSYDKASPLYIELMNKGELIPDIAISLFPGVITYMLTNENTDTAKLKQQLKIAEIIYKSKAHQWKGADGEVNPWLNFLAMIQDTLSSL